jgi:hypothetical protein
MTEPLHARIRRRADLAIEGGLFEQAAMLDWLADEADSIDLDGERRPNA